jgi:hypothetical protein
MKRGLLVAVSVTIFFLMQAGSAFGFHCYVKNKNPDAGDATFADIKAAGNSGKLVVPGAFIDGSEFGESVDVFRHGQPVGEEEIVGVGTLPSQPHTNGGDNGVQSL